MDQGRSNQIFHGHRGACDECSQRKVKCISDGGACHNCIAWGKTCTYSPRVPVGRPRKRRAATTPNLKDAETNKPSSSKSQRPHPIMPRTTFNNETIDSDSVPELVRSTCSTSSSSLSSQVDLLTSLADSNHPVENAAFSDILMRQLSHATADGASKPLPHAFSPRSLDMSKPLDSDIGPTTKSRTDHSSARPRPATLSRPAPPPSSYPSHRNSYPEFSIPESLTPLHPKPRRRASTISFNSLLNNVLSLRSRYDSLVTAMASLTSRNSTFNSYADINPVVDNVVGSAATFYDDVEPYLNSLLSQGSDASTYQNFQEIQTMICLIITASSTILDAVRMLQGLLDTILSLDGGGRVSARLKHILLLSSISFHVRRCRSSLDASRKILATAESIGFSITNVPVETITVTSHDAVDVQRQIEHTMNTLKVPDDGRYSLDQGTCHT